MKIVEKLRNTVKKIEEKAKAKKEVNNGFIFSFNIKKYIKKGVNAVKEAFKWVFKKIHKGLTWIEDKLLEKLDDLGTWAYAKIEERLPEPEPEPVLEIEPEPIE